MNETQVKHLMDTGLSKLQARIYISLIMESNQTGYRIAQKLNEPVANTYKALEVLISKGIVVLDKSGAKKHFSALPIENYFNQMELDFARKRKIIEDEFKKTQPQIVHEGIFKIENINQLYETAKSIIRQSTEAIAIDSSLLPLKQLESDLQKVSQKGIKVIIKTYQEITIPNCDVVYIKEPESPIHSNNIQYFNIANPGKEQLSSLLNKKNSEIIEAIHIKSKFLSFISYNGIMSEFALTKLLTNMNNKSIADLLNEWEKINAIKPSKIKAAKELFSSI